MSDRPRIAILDDPIGAARASADWSAVEARADIVIFSEPFASLDDAVEALDRFDCLVAMRERTAMPRAFFERLPGLKAVSSTGPRNAAIDVAAAADHGVVVMHTGSSGAGAFATTELAWALILGVLKDIPLNDAAMRDGRWQTRLGQVLAEARLGLVGVGRLGARMAPIAKALGMEVVGWSPNLTPERAAEAGVQAVSREALFETSDIVSIHMVLSDRTRGLVGADEIGRMRPGAVLVNTSRAGLVEKAPLLAALEAGAIRAGIDVYETEPVPGDDPWRSAPNTVLSPHMGYCTDVTFQHYYGDSVENVLAWLDGAPIRVMGG